MAETNLQNLFENQLMQFYYMINPNAERIPLKVHLTDNLYAKHCELRPDRDPCLIPMGNDYNGTTVVPHLLNDPINIIFNTKKIEEYSKDESLTWIGTFGHELTHAIDYYQMARMEGLDCYDPLEETDKYYLF